MPDSIEFSSDIGPIVALVSLPHSESARTDQFAQLRIQQAICRTATEQYAQQLNRLYEDIARSGHNADWLVQAAELVRQREATERERLRPGIEALKQKLALWRGPRDAEGRRLIEESIAVGEAWLSFPAALYKRLLRLADKRRAAAEEIQRARPFEGEIDHAELTREIIARFPTILAELAK
jgi:hypothetical protein